MIFGRLKCVRKFEWHARSAAQSHMIGPVLPFEMASQWLRDCRVRALSKLHSRSLETRCASETESQRAHSFSLRDLAPVRAAAVCVLNFSLVQIAYSTHAEELSNKQQLKKNAVVKMLF